MGIFLNAIMTIAGSLFMMIAKHQAEDSMRIFGGGYVMLSRVIIGFLEVTGCVWGIIGLMGAWQCKERYLEIYNYYQMARVTAWLGMYVTDGPVLWYCELWMTDIHAAIEMQGYNPIMYRIALEGRCPQERFLFMIFSSMGFMFFLYLTYINQVFQRMLADEPAYLLRVPKQNPGGAYYVESFAEKRYLLGGEVGPAIHAPRSGGEPGAYVPLMYAPVKKTAWETGERRV